MKKWKTLVILFVFIVGILYNPIGTKANEEIEFEGSMQQINTSVTYIAYSQNSKATKKLNTYLGADENVVDWLESHAYDDYYLGTAFHGVRNNNMLNCIRPNGEHSTDAGMNCTGFVASGVRFLC